MNKLTPAEKAERKALRARERAERKAARKAVKKDGNRVGFGLLWYLLINFAVVFVWMGVEIAMAVFGVSDPAEADRLINEVAERAVESGSSMIAGVLVGLGFLFLFFRKRGVISRLFHREETMSIKKFAGIACVFFGTQLIFNGAYYLMEAGLNLIGYSAVSSMESATAGSTTLSMFLYAGIIGPVVEELVFRGFVLRSLDKYGKNLAIVISSALFGIMHGNIPQAVFAFLTGLVFGYVASKYSIVWCIILHILNNMVLGDLLNLALSGLSETMQEIIFLGIMSVFTIVGIIVLIVKRRTVIDFVKQNRSQRPNFRWIATCSGVVIYFLVNLALGISMLEKI